MMPVSVQQLFLAAATATAKHADTAVQVEAAAEHGGKPELPSLVAMLFGKEGFAHHWINVEYAFFIAVVFSIAAYTAYSKRQMIPGPFQNFVEILVEGMYNFVHSILGKDTKTYIPYLGTLFFYILAMNLIGLVPLGHSPSTSLNITASLAILTFLFAQWTGMKRMGFVGYVDHLAGQPRTVVSWVLVIIMFPIHIIGELAKPFSLAIRLFGNITGEDVLVAAFVGLGVMLMGVLGLPHSPVGIPLQIPFYFLGILLSAIQALVFTLLSTIYILMMIPHEEHH
jgi:F-type H+-transporting ATPase subunit a